YLQVLPQLAQGEGNTFFVIPSELTAALQGVSRALSEALPRSEATNLPPASRDTSEQAAQDAASAADAAADAVAEAQQPLDPAALSSADGGLAAPRTNNELPTPR
ncbi:MAG TPA: hypothetical protein VNO83_00005, partial [Pseudonocardia sp.]|nr:hypothetical protein [Pseudonocardia sp.]